MISMQKLTECMEIKMTKELQNSLALAQKERDRALVDRAKLVDELKSLNKLIGDNNDDYERLIEQYDRVRYELKEQKHTFELINSLQEKFAGQENALRRLLNDTLAENVRLANELKEKCVELKSLLDENDSLNKDHEEIRLVCDQLNERLAEKTRETDVLRRELNEISVLKNEALENIQSKYQRVLDIINLFRRTNCSDQHPSTSKNDDKVEEEGDDDKLKNVRNENDFLNSLTKRLKNEKEKLSSDLKQKEKKLKKYKSRCEDYESDLKTLKIKIRRLENKGGALTKFIPDLEKVQKMLSNMNERMSNNFGGGSNNLQTSSPSNSNVSSKTTTTSKERKRSSHSLSHSSTDDEPESLPRSSSGGSAQLAPLVVQHKPVRFQLSKRSKK